MSESLAPTKKSLPPAVAAQAAAAKPNPLRMAPREFRPAVAGFWMLNEHLLATPLSLAARVGRWVERDGLTVAELKEVFAAASEPEVMARHQFAGQLMADLAGKVADVVRRRRAMEAMIARRAAGAGPPNPVKDLAAGVGTDANRTEEEREGRRYVPLDEDDYDPRG